MATVFAKDDFDAEAAAGDLKASMKGLGTDEEAIIAVLASHNNEQLQEIKEYYKTSYGEDLVDELKGELGGNFETVVVALMAKPRMYDARELRAAMKGAGTDEATLIEIMCSRSNDEIEEVKECYKEEFDRDLEEDLMSETSGYFKRLLVSQCNAGREESEEIDWDRAGEDAQAIYDAGEGQFGTDESTLNSILCTRDYQQLRGTFQRYKEISEKDIEDAIKTECSGSLEDGFMAIVNYSQDPQAFFAKRLYRSMKGLGTDDNTLIRVIVSRCEKDLDYIQTAFQAHFEQSLREFLEGDCDGDFKRMLLCLIN